MTDWRGLCAELLAEWDSYGSGGDAWDRARAALARPEPEGVTDEELDIVVIAIQRLAPDQPDGPTQPTHDLHAVDRGREILKKRLARWGRPAIEPVPVAERLPGAEDCNAESECFWFDGCDWKLDTFEKWYTHWLPHWALPVPSPPPQNRNSTPTTSFPEKSTTTRATH